MEEKLCFKNGRVNSKLRFCEKVFAVHVFNVKRNSSFNKLYNVLSNSLLSLPAKSRGVVVEKMYFALLEQKRRYFLLKRNKQISVPQ